MTPLASLHWLLAQAEASSPPALTAAGWSIMLVSLSAVIALNAFCFYRVLTIPAGEAEDHLKAPLEIDTGDDED